MNERIQQLAEQAREYATTRHSVSNIILSVNSDLFEQKFAELIVKECANWIESQDEAEHPTAWLLCEDLLQHFGVEE
jgi:hypothetical protein